MKKQLSLNETHVKVWYKAFILLNRLSMRFVIHEIKEDQKARTACRRNFLLNFLQRIPTNLNLDNLPFQSERAVGVLAALRHNQTVQNVILAADTAHRIRNEVTHQPLNDAILEDYTELCQNNVF